MKKTYPKPPSRQGAVRQFSVSPARKASFEILQKIQNEKAFSSALLSKYGADLSQKDRSLCHELTLGVLRNQIYLDAIVEKLANKTTEKFDLAVVLAMRIGLYQLLFLDKVPVFAAINESVNLVQIAKKTSAKNLVNAILRRAAREKTELEFVDEIEKLSVETSHPKWLLEKWISEFGFEETEKIAKANNEVPRSAFRFTNKAHGSNAEMGNVFTASKFVEGCFLARTIDPNLIELSEKGEIYFQDEASQMVARAVSIEKNDIFLDVCASPGGKTTQVAMRAPGTATLVGGDLHWHRVKFLQENCHRQGAEFACILQYDAEKSLPFADDSFDSVLVDAPCSGTGTIRHNPEIRYFLRESDFAALPEKQLTILKNASKVVRNSGHLIYSTCSLEFEENEAVVEAFLRENPNFRKVSPNVSEKFLTAEGFARTFPHRDEMDGFFIAAFQKKA